MTDSLTTKPALTAIRDSFRLPRNLQGKTKAINGAKISGKASDLNIDVQDHVGKIELEVGIGDVLVKTYDRNGKQLDVINVDKFALAHHPNNVTSEKYRYRQININGGRDYQVIANRSKDNLEQNNPLINPENTTRVILGSDQKGVIEASGNIFEGKVKIFNIDSEKTPAAALLSNMRHGTRELASA